MTGWDSTLLKVASAGVALLGLAALVVLVAPAVQGQIKARPALQLSGPLFAGSEIGVSVRDLDDADVRREKLAGLAGAIIEEVRKDGPAARAGFRAGDIVTTFDGERVRSARHFVRVVAETPDGREVQASVLRNGQTVALTVVPEASDAVRGLLAPLRELRDFEFRMPERFSMTVPEVQRRDDLLDRLIDRRGRLGVTVQELTPQLAEYFGAPDGVLVAAVDDGTPAKAAGLRAGDVITKVNGQAVRSADELRRRLQGASGEVTIALVRDRRELTVTAKLAEADRDARRIVRREH